MRFGENSSVFIANIYIEHKSCINTLCFVFIQFPPLNIIDLNVEGSGLKAKKETREKNITGKRVRTKRTIKPT